MPYLGLNYNGVKPLELLFGYAPSDNGGVTKAQCAAFKMEPTTSPVTGDGSKNGGPNGASKPGAGTSMSRNSVSWIGMS